MALISEAKGGKDPAALRDKGLKAATMKVLGKRFLEEYVPVHCKPSTAYEYRRSVKFFIDPRIGTRKVTEIQRSDIAELHHGMRETPYQANRTLGVLSKMFNLAELWGLRPDGSNPCLHVKRYKEEKRERFLSAEEFTRLGQVLDEILGDGSETRSAVVPPIYLICRRNLGILHHYRIPFPAYTRSSSPSSAKSSLAALRFTQKSFPSASR